MSRINRIGSWALPALSLLAGSAMANADITFEQTTDDMWLNRYRWDAQEEEVARRLDPGKLVGTVEDVWIRIRQKDGSQAANAVMCTTMRKVRTSGFTDIWAVRIPPGSLTDKDFRDATRIGSEFVDCDDESGSNKNYQSLPTPFGTVDLVDFSPGTLEPDPDARYAQIDPGGWDSPAVRAEGYDFAVLAYMGEDGTEPLWIMHLDELALTGFTYDRTDAFGSGVPLDIQKLQLVGVDLDPRWDLMPEISTGLNFLDWDIPGGWMISDQGDFQILRFDRLDSGWRAPCPADIDGDGDADVADFFAFVTAFAAGDPITDINGDGSVDVGDFFAFVSAFAAGCA